MKLCLFSDCCFPFALCPLTAAFTSEQLLGLSVFFLKRLLLIYLCRICSCKKKSELQEKRRKRNHLWSYGLGVTKKNIFKGVLPDLFKRLESCVGVYRTWMWSVYRWHSVVENAEAFRSVGLKSNKIARGREEHYNTINK